MVKRSNIFRMFVAVALGCFFVSCTSLPLLVPNPPAAQKKETPAAAPVKIKEEIKPAETPSLADHTTVQYNKSDSVRHLQVSVKANAETGKEVDFALALVDTQTRDTASTTAMPVQQGKEAAVAEPPVAVPGQPETMADLPVAGKMIRAALRRNCAKIMLYSMDTMEIRAPSLSKAPWFVGRLTVTALGKGVVDFAIGNEAPREVVLPCTLAPRDASSLVDLGQENYRGTIVLSGKDNFTVVNYIDVEDYLRGVIPLEMGTQGKGAPEALKAQAITARTYAYKRITAHSTEPFDVVSTVADQVYGGADVETPEIDDAVRSTSGFVLAWHGALADVYYHSTCGGMTADIAEAWGRTPCEYLSSVSDTAPDGKAWCNASKYFTWEETWSADKLSKIVRSTVKKSYPAETFAGVLQDITVYSRYNCGRVKSCALKGSEGSAVCGGDKIRFVLRRKSVTGEILRSADFTVEKNGPDKFVIHGKGYGHGVGLCQMGAIGRAQAGQSFREILAAYFKNTEIKKAVVDEEEKK